MRRRLLLWTVLVGMVALLPGSRAGAQAAQEFASIKGRIEWGGQQVPPRTEIKVSIDAGFILQANLTANPKQGTVQSDSLLINVGNRGIKDVFVWLVPKNPGGVLPMHRRLAAFPAEPLVIHTHAGAYRPRAAAMREGQVLVVRNRDPIAYATRWFGDPAVNPGGAVQIKPGNDMVVKDLQAQRLPLMLECMIHGWMKGRVAIFTHPYYAITDLNGDFEIKVAPVGEFRLMIYHEYIGYRLGAQGKNGEPITIQTGVNNLGKLPMGT
jgi:hypothetical protein